MNSQQIRFFNFPLILNMKLISEPAPKTAFDEIAAYALCEYAGKLDSGHDKALIQACYLSVRKKETDLPSAIRRIIQRNEIYEFSELLNECWGTNDFRHEASTLLEERKIELSADERRALTDWHRLYKAASFFNISKTNYEGIERLAKTARGVADEHKRQFGALAHCSSEVKYFYDAQDKFTIENGRVFRMVCAVRSIIGEKAIAGTVKDMIRARMIGAKSKDIAERLASANPAIREEWEALKSRKRFDRLIERCSVDGFFGKFGKGRRIYLSTQIKDPVELAQQVQITFSRKAAYKERQTMARCITRKKMLLRQILIPQGTP